MKSIVVFCGSSEGNDENFGKQAHELGKTLAQKNLVLVYGGAKIGIMGKVANGALENKGKVVGVIPDFLKEREVFHNGLFKLIITKNMHDRKLKMHELSDGIIMLPGGFGTLEEFFEMLTWSQLGLHKHPIGILNTNGFYDDLLQMMQSMVHKGFVKEDNFKNILVDSEIDSLLNKMEHHKPFEQQKRITKDQL